jgi:hypothetical protein
MFESLGTAAKLSPQESAAKLINEVNEEITRHERNSNSQSYLARPFDYLYGKDERTLSQLKELQVSLDTQMKRGDTNSILSKKDQIADAIKTDNGAMQTQDHITGLGKALVTTVPLFMKGPAAFVGTVVAFGLDRATPGTSLETQALDFTLGGLQGAALKGTFMLSEHIPGGLAGRAVGMGVMNRFSGSVLNRSTYIDPESGQFSGTHALMSTLKGTFNAPALATDIATFAIAGTAVGITNRATAGLLTRSPLLATPIVGGVFGFSGGMTGEFARQLENHERVSWTKALTRGAEHGAITAIAAIPGGIQGQMQLDASRKSYLAELEAAEKPAAKVIKTDTYSVASVDGEPLYISKQLGKGENGNMRVRVDQDGRAFLRGDLKDFYEVEVNAKRIGSKEIQLKPGDVVTAKADVGDRYAIWERQPFNLSVDAKGQVKLFDQEVSRGSQAFSNTTTSDTRVNLSTDSKQITITAGAGQSTRVNGVPLADNTTIPGKVGDVIEYRPEPSSSVVQKATIGTTELTDTHVQNLQLNPYSYRTTTETPSLWSEVGAKGKGLTAWLDSNGSPYVMDNAPLSSSIFAPDRLRINNRPVPTNTPIPLLPGAELKYNGELFKNEQTLSQPENISVKADYRRQYYNRVQ